MNLGISEPERRIDLMSVRIESISRHCIRFEGLEKPGGAGYFARFVGRRRSR